MAFCTNCGSSTSGDFCTNCGARSEGAASNPIPAPPPPAAAMPKKKTNPLVWVLVGILGLVVVVGLTAVVGGIFIAKKVADAGDNPAFAAAKLMAQMNPDVEITNADQESGKITLREKKTGKEITMDFRDIQKGRISFSGDGETVEMKTGEGEQGAFEVTTKEGTARFGAGPGVSLPAWVPAYPGSKPEGQFSSEKAGKSLGTVSYKTADAADKAIAFYASALESAGMKVTKTAFGEVKNVIGESEGRRVTVNALPADGQTQLMISYEGK